MAQSAINGSNFGQAGAQRHSHVYRATGLVDHELRRKA
jgi:hypothetical protein